MADSQSGFLILWAVICVAVVLAMAYWVTKYVAGRGLLSGGPVRRKGGQIEVLSQESLGRDQRLAAVRVGERYFLLGITPSTISHIAELTREDAMAATEQTTQGTSPGFFEAFSDVWKQKTNRR